MEGAVESASVLAPSSPVVLKGEGSIENIAVFYKI